MAVNPSPFGPKPQFELSDGTPAVGNQLFFYVGGSVNTKQNTYTDSTGGSANANPLILNALGQPTTQIWFTSGQLYKVVYAPSTDTDPPTSPIWTIDNLAGINDSTINPASEWVSGPAPTFIGVGSFSLVGDQTATFTIGRRLRFTVTAGTVYGRITASTFAAVTTVTVQMDGAQVLDSGLTAVSYALLSSLVKSEPERIATTAGTDTYTATVGISRLVIGDQYKIKIATANTSTTPTLNLDGTGAKTIISPAGTALVAGDLNGEHTFRWNGTNMVVLNPVGPQPLPRMSISGLTYANNAGDATNDLDFAVGSARDASDAGNLFLTSALTKQSDAAWAVGTGAGALDNIGSAGNNDFYIWLIKRLDTGVVDVLFSLSSTAPTMPANYTLKRLIGWFKRVGGAIVLFHTYETEGGGIEMNWDSPTLDVNLANTLTTASRSDAVKVPLNFSVVAHLNVLITDAAVTGAWIRCPDQTDLAPSATVSPLFNIINQVAAVQGANQMFLRTSATGTIAARATTATVDLYAVVTLGFRWARRN